MYLGTTSPTDELSSFGRKVTINKVETVREGRTANGSLNQDILYTKKEFVLAYETITESALAIIEYWYDYYKTNKTPLTLYVYTSPTTYDQFTVIPRPVNKTRLIKSVDNLFSGIEFRMDEV